LNTKISKLLIFSLIVIFGCAYYNTFFNAKDNYNQAVKKQKKVKSDQVGGDVKKNFNKAIEKSWKLIDFYGDSSKYADDALLLIGQSYYNLQDYAKSERVLEQFLLKYIKSDLIPEAKLWLAKTYIAFEKEDQALEILDNLFESKVSNKIAAQSFYILGDLYFQNQDYEKSIENLQKCVEVTSDDEIEGNAEYMTGEAFYFLEQYENAITHFKKLEKLDVPPLREYEALTQKVNAMAELKQYDEADQILRIMLRNQRFKDQFSMIETKLANISEMQGQSEYALELYSDVLDKYPRKEGAALSSFYIGQLYEYEYGNFDSAKTYYDNVKKQFNKSEAVEDAGAKSVLLNEYIKIRDQLVKDRKDYASLLRGDSILVDSIALEPEPIDSTQLFLELPSEDDFISPRLTMDQEDSTKADSLLDSLQLVNKEKEQNKKKKIAVSRDPEEVEGSLIKSSFAIAEYFLLKYQNYDSAAVSYQSFVQQFNDSTLTPKAYYALNYILNNIYSDTVKADSIKDIILENYPNTIYGKKLTGEEVIGQEESKDTGEETISRQKYLVAENYMDQADYSNAIRVFQEIAEQDSGSVWAQKSRYAIGYLYERLVADTLKAISSYTDLVNEYPNTEFGKIAKKKIAEPPKEIPVDSSKTDSITAEQTSEDFQLNSTDRDTIRKDKDIDQEKIDIPKEEIKNKELIDESDGKSNVNDKIDDDSKQSPDKNKDEQKTESGDKSKVDEKKDREK